MSLFTVKNYADEFLSALDKGFKKSLPEEDESVGATAEEIIENTKDFILKEISRQLKGYDLEEFVADLLQAIGYRTTVSRTVATVELTSPPIRTELPPRILVQVKSQDGGYKGKRPFNLSKAQCVRAIMGCLSLCPTTRKTRRSILKDADYSGNQWYRTG